MWSAPSQRRIQHGIDIATQRFRVHARQSPPPLDQRGRTRTSTRQRSELRDRVAVACDDHTFAALYPAQYVPALVSQFAYRDCLHKANVSPVRRTSVSATAAGIVMALAGGIGRYSVDVGEGSRRDRLRELLDAIVDAENTECRRDGAQQLHVGISLLPRGAPADRRAPGRDAPPHRA